MREPFAAARFATGSTPERADRMNLYGWLIGAWDGDSLVWHGELSAEGGESWYTNIEFRAKRGVASEAAGLSAIVYAR